MRKHKLTDCDPCWATDNGQTRFLRFECPEGHEDCPHAIPFTPSLEGPAMSSPQVNGAQWARVGDAFETLTLTPSIRRIPSYASRDAAVAAGCAPEHVTASMLCAFHGFITAGAVVFCGDSR